MSHTPAPSHPEPSEERAPLALAADSTPGPEWCFYLTDDDRSVGWTNHGLVLQYVCVGYGATPREAWADALASRRVPSGYLADGPTTPDVAILSEHHRRLND